MQKGEHFVHVTSASDAANATRWAVDHPDEVDKIRANVRAYLATIPDPDVYLCHLVEQYVKLVQLYTPVVPVSAADLATSLVDPYYPRG